MTIHVEPTDLVGVEHRTLAFTRYDGTAAIDVPGELLTVTQDPDRPAPVVRLVHLRLPHHRHSRAGNARRGRLEACAPGTFRPRSSAPALRAAVSCSVAGDPVIAQGQP